MFINNDSWAYIFNIFSIELTTKEDKNKARE